MNNKLFSWKSLDIDLSSLLLRLIFGGMFIRFGWIKIKNYDQYLSGFSDFIGLGVSLSFNLLVIAEFGCGILIAIGLLTRFAAIPVFFAMNVAFFIAHAKDPFDVKLESLTFLLFSVVVFVAGSGKYSIDRLIFKDKTGA